MSKEEAAKATVELGGHCLLTRGVGTRVGLLNPGATKTAQAHIDMGSWKAWGMSEVD